MKKKTKTISLLFFLISVIALSGVSVAGGAKSPDVAGERIPLPTPVETLTLKHAPRTIKSMQKVAFYGTVPQGTPDGAKVSILFIGIGIDAYGTVEAAVAGEKFSKELLLEEPGDYWALATLQKSVQEGRQDTSPKIRITVVSGDLTSSDASPAS